MYFKLHSQFHNFTKEIVNLFFTIQNHNKQTKLTQQCDEELVFIVFFLRNMILVTTNQAFLFLHEIFLIFAFS